MNMRRTMLLAGVLGLMTGYLFGRSSLRRDMMRARSTADALKLFATEAVSDALEAFHDLRMRLDIPLLNRRAARKRAPALPAVRPSRPVGRPERRPLAPVTARRNMERAKAATREAQEERQTTAA